MTPKVSILVLNYNGLRHLDACLDSVLRQESDFAFELVLVDNASTDGSVEHVRARFPDVRVLPLDRNHGFAGGYNRALKDSDAPYRVLLNNDTRVREGWLQPLVDTADADPSAGCVTSKVMFMDPAGTIQNAGSLLLTDGSGADRGFQELDRGQYDGREEVFGGCGASMLLRAEMLHDVGLLDETFFAYYEDTDLNWRMRLRGWKVIYEPASVVEHAHSGTAIEWSPFFIFHVDRNRLFMILKNAPARMVLASFAGFATRSARNVLRVLLSRAASRLRRGHDTGGEAGKSGARASLHTRVLVSFCAHLPEMLWKRVMIRRRRRVGDDEIRKWLYPKSLWDARSV